MRNRIYNMITLEDIATTVSASVPTVSDVLRGKGDGKRISKKLQEAILNTAKEMKYRPNHLARSLVLQKTKTIGVVIPDMTTQFFPPVIDTIENIARSKNYHIILCLSEENSEIEKECIDTLIGKWVDGIIIAPTEIGFPNIEYFKELEKRKIPIVFIDRYIGETEKNYVVIDNVLGAYEAVSYLIKMGHVKILHIAGPNQISGPRDRHTGYRKAIEKHGLKYDERLVKEIVDLKMESGYKAMKQSLGDRSSFTAVFAVNDMVAIGASKALTEAGLRIPEDISLVGFDDIQLASFLQVPLTTINQQQHNIGEIATNLLIDKIEGKIEDKPKQVVLKPQLVVRKSCKFLNSISHKSGE